MIGIFLKKTRAEKVSPELSSLFNLIIIYRYLTLSQIYLLTITGIDVIPPKINFMLLVIGFIYTTTLLIFSSKIIDNCINRPAFFPLFISIDLFFDLIFMTVGAGWRSSWYFYTISTALLATIFKKLKGAFLTAASLCLINGISGFSTNLVGTNLINKSLLDDMFVLIFNGNVGYFFISSLFSLPMVLLEKLNETRVELECKANSLNETEETLSNLKKQSSALIETVNNMLEPENFLKLINKKPFLLESSPQTGNYKNNKLIFSLTDKEREVLSLLAAGLTNQEISDKIGISTHTVDTHRRSIYQKLQVNSSAQAIAIALSSNLLINQVTQ